MTRIAVIAGDGIGKEVTAEAVKVLKTVASHSGKSLHLEHLPWSADHYLATGETLPADGYRMLRDDFAAILCRRARRSARARQSPCPRHPAWHALRARSVRQTIAPFDCSTSDCYARSRVVAAKTSTSSSFVKTPEGVYVSVGGRFKPGTEDEVAVQEEINTFKGVNRIIRHAFEYARVAGADQGLHGRQEQRHDSRATPCGNASSSKSRPSTRPSAATHMSSTRLAMFLVKDPGQFQVIVTNNLFGDIVTDIGGALQGGLGMAASGNIHPGRTSLFEPVHGSAPPLAGKNVANPIGAILSAALMLDTTRLEGRSPRHRGASSSARCTQGQTTSDIGGSLGTREVGDWITRAVAQM